MDGPVYKLEGVVKAKDETLDFEGPLELILQLLSKDKIEIRDVSVSLILEQYLAYLDVMAKLDLDIATEFIAMASHLTYIKTKMLLSGGEEVSELEQLISSLEDLQRGDIYLQIRAAAEALSGMYSPDGVMMAGPPEYLPPDNEYKYAHEAADLLQAIFQVVGRENALIESVNPREAVYPRRVIFSIPEKISEIVEKLRQNGNMRADDLFYDCANRAELVATLVAVLELCRVGAVMLTGGAGEMTITYTGAGRELSAADFTEEI